jgi:ParB-like chromosome segregation protein Spo0J
MASKSEYETWPLDRFKPHPRQADIFGDLPDDKLAELAEDLRANGQKDAVQALPDGTLVGGHQRLRAARQLGWKTLKVNVRHDLAGARPAAVESALIKDNLFRRHLSPMGRVRCYVRVTQAESGEYSKGWPSQRMIQVVADRLGMSPRNLSRYLRIMGAPPEVQAAFERGEITLTETGKVASSVNRDRIAWRLRKGEPARTVLAEELKSTGTGHPNPRLAFIRRADVLCRELAAIAQTEDAIDRDLLHTYQKVFQQGKELLARLIRRARGYSD